MEDDHSTIAVPDPTSTASDTRSIGPRHRDRGYVASARQPSTPDVVSTSSVHLWPPAAASEVPNRRAAPHPASRTGEVRGAPPTSIATALASRESPARVS